MESSNDMFSMLEYLSIFTAFIYGYVATRFFSGWSAMINFRHSIRFSTEHFGWTLLTFGLLIDIWWGSWIKGQAITRHVTFYYLSLLSPIIFYLISIVLFPPFHDDRFLDLRKYFASMRKRQYLVFIALFISFLINDFFFKPLIISGTYFNVVAILLAVIGYFAHSVFVHRFILVTAWTMLLAHITFQSPVWSTDKINGFSLMEYLTVFIAFIYGFVASKFFSGWGMMITKFNRITFSKEHIAWTLLAFGLLMDFWTGSWEREKFISLNINYFILSLTLPMAFYVVVAISFPTVKNGEQIDLRGFYQSNKKLIYSLFACAIFLNAVVANVMEESTLLSSENIFRVIGISLAMIASFSRKQFMERSVLVLGWITLLVHTFIDF